MGNAPNAPITQFQYNAELKAEQLKADNWFAALDAARPSATYVSQFVQLFPSAQVNYRYFTRTGEPGFDVSADLYERYELTMQLPVVFDSAGRKVVGYGEPKFVMGEAEKVERFKNGGASVWYDPSGELSFGSMEWKKIFASSGDFSAIGYSMKKNEPISGFKDRNAPLTP